MQNNKIFEIIETIKRYGISNLNNRKPTNLSVFSYFNDFSRF